jgi:hypothetical protein
MISVAIAIVAVVATVAVLASGSVGTEQAILWEVYLLQKSRHLHKFQFLWKSLISFVNKVC